MKRQTLYWSLQVFGWSLLTGVLIISVLAFNSSEHLGALIQLQIIIGSVLLLASHGMRHLYKRLNFLNLPTFRLVLLVVLAALLFSALGQGVIQSMIYGLLSWSEIQPFSFQATILYWTNTSIILIVWSVLYIAIRGYESRREQEVENWKLRAELREAELAILKAQINPHFLFNALNNVRSLISENSDLARDMVSALSDLLRYAISHTSGDLVPVSDELEIVKQYMSLEKMQYEERLEVCYDIDPDTNRCNIPPMVIQMLAENAVKHGISRQSQPGKLEIVVARSDEILTVRVINSGRLDPAATGGGIGISNIKKRLSNVADDGWAFSLRQLESSKVESKIEIPCHIHQPKNN